MNGEADDSCLVSMHVLYALGIQRVNFIHFPKVLYVYLEKTNSLQTDPYLGVATESVQFK